MNIKINKDRFYNLEQRFVMNFINNWFSIAAAPPTYREIRRELDGIARHYAITGDNVPLWFNIKRLTILINQAAIRHEAQHNPWLTMAANRDFSRLEVGA